MKTKRLYETNMEVLTVALTELQHRNITKFETQNLLLKFLEEIKFPFTMEWRKRGGGGMDRKAYYSQTNYTPVMDWMMDRGVLNKIPETGKIVYTVNQEKLANLTDLSTTYTTANGK